MRTFGIVFVLLVCSACSVAQTTPAEPPQEISEEIAAQFTGSWQQGGLIFGALNRTAKVLVDGREILVSPDGQFVFGIGRDHQDPINVTVRTADGQEKVYQRAIQQRTYDVQRIEGVQQKHVTPPKSVLERTRREAQQVREARERNDTRVDYAAEFIWPLVGPITGVYGSQRVYNGVPKTPHYGLDIAAPTGTPVIAPADGLVTLAEPDLFYSGGTIILDHGHGLSSTFIHLHKVVVEAGAVIQQGQVIGQVGATGRATGPHLDWRMNWFTTRVDPQLLMADIPMPAHNSR